MRTTVAKRQSMPCSYHGNLQTGPEISASKRINIHGQLAGHRQGAAPTVPNVRTGRKLGQTGQ